MYIRFAAILSLVGALTLSASPKAFQALSPPSSRLTPLQKVLTPNGEDLEVSFSSETGEGLLTLSAEAPGTSWEQEQNRAAVLQVSVDHQKVADIVMHQGAKAFSYQALLGPLTSGEHTITLRLHPDIGGFLPVELSGFSVAVVPPGNPLYEAYAHAPVLLGRAGHPLNDIPLVLYSEPSSSGHKYTLIFSNEDGGTSGPKLLSRWGRRVDIEWMYEGDGKTGTYQATRHRTKVFDGGRRGQHPLLEVASKNNNFKPLPEDPSRAWTRPVVALVPTVFPEPVSNRERVLDFHPWATHLSQLELEREGMESPANPDTPEVSDLRGYLYIDCALSLREESIEVPGDPEFIKGSHLVFEATLENGQKVRSDHGKSPKSYGLYRHGWARTSIELPEGTLPHQIRSLEAQWRGRGFKRPPTLHAVRAFMVDENFVPGPTQFTFLGAEPGDNGHNLSIPKLDPGVSYLLQ